MKKVFVTRRNLIGCLAGTILCGVAFATPSPGGSSLLEAYATVQAALAEDKLTEAKEGSRELLVRLGTRVSKSGGGWRQPLAKMRVAAKALSSASEMPEARQSFGVLSEVAVLIARADKKLQADWRLYHCPMAPGFKFWLQPVKDSATKNPYMGLTMQRCGSGESWQ